MVLIDLDKEVQAARLRGSLLEFMRFFYEYLTDREFIVSQPVGRESPQITICRTLTDVFELKYENENLNVPPGTGKSTDLCLWIAWAWAHYSDCNFLYLSHTQELAAGHTAFVRSILTSRMYQYLFGTTVDKDSRAKDSFKTSGGGALKAYGTKGPVTGQNAGLPNLNRFSGALIIDDAHKPDEAHSDTIRENILANYDLTIRQRCRGIKVPIIHIGQRVHEDDLTGYFLSGKDTKKWHSTILKGLDEAGNALYPEIMPKETLLELKAKSPYVFASQYQQDPLPAGGALFLPKYFPLLEKEPQILASFITADTAETVAAWNDASVFSFWGVYEIETLGRKTGQLALHWLDCIELRIEPKDLKDSFIDFYANCMRHPVAPLLAAIEKKSTGVTLLSILKELRGIQIREIDRHIGSGSKSDRFVSMQSFIAAQLISLPAQGMHTQMCLNHMAKITANNTHRHDDIADTVYDAIRIALIEKTLYNPSVSDSGREEILESMNNSLQNRLRIGAARYARHA
jgi:predicted phage terminase large subunit-like protein